MKPFPDQEPQRLYYHIGQIADILGVSTAVVRNWCKWFGIKTLRYHNDDRKFTERELWRLKVIFILLRVEGMTIRGIKQELNIK